MHWPCKNVILTRVNTHTHSITAKHMVASGQQQHSLSAAGRALDLGQTASSTSSPSPSTAAPADHDCGCGGISLAAESEPQQLEQTHTKFSGSLRAVSTSEGCCSAQFFFVLASFDHTAVQCCQCWCTHSLCLSAYLHLSFFPLSLAPLYLSENIIMPFIEPTVCELPASEVLCWWWWWCQCF